MDSRNAGDASHVNDTIDTNPNRSSAKINTAALDRSADFSNASPIPKTADSPVITNPNGSSGSRGRGPPAGSGSSQTPSKSPATTANANDAALAGSLSRSPAEKSDAAGAKADSAQLKKRAELDKALDGSCVMLAPLHLQHVSFVC